MSVEEFFERCTELAMTEPSAAALRFMHETLVLTCAEGLKAESTGFGSLFAQVDFLAKHCGMKPQERRAVQQMRRHSNHVQVPQREEWLQDVRALALFGSAIFKTAIPHALTTLIPHQLPAPTDLPPVVNCQYLRCIVEQWDERTIQAETTNNQKINIDYTDHPYLNRMLREGMQLNLLDNHVENSTVLPGIVVVEPDFLIDISALARCFQTEYGHHPLLYTTERLKPRGNSQAMLLGNFAGAVLDGMINDRDFKLGETLNSFFREQALQFATCEEFKPEQFLDDAQIQSANILEAVTALFAKDYDREKALLEPSFVCERLGIQGRADLMTSDMRLLVEQKSGKNYSIERQTGTPIAYKEDHYVQLLLYYGVLRYNFGRTNNQVDIRLLYSRYPAALGLLYVSYYRELLREAIRLRNQIVATEMLIAREGFGRIVPLLHPEVIYKGIERDGFFCRYIEPPVATISQQIAAASPLERAYYERMMTFVYREQLLQKVGRQEGMGSAASDLWNMPLAEKIETGNIILSNNMNPSLNFRRGDMVYLYNYKDEEPDARQAILHKGTLVSIDGNGVKVRMNEGQSADDIMKQGKWAIEHAVSDQNTTSAIKSLHQFISANSDKKKLLLGQRAPQQDTSLVLTRSYHEDYDAVLLRAKQARDYFLLIGPPGTGKTSMALRFLVEEELSSPNLQHSTPNTHHSTLNTQPSTPNPQLLLTAYTNRAVDEICAMLEDAGHDYIRIASETSCDQRFTGHLIEAMLGPRPKLDDIRRRIGQTPIIVGTTSMLQARPWIFQLKHFSLCIVDEASQILEPGLVGLLTSHSVDRFILIGDHKQLPAVVQQSEEESRVDDPLLNGIGISDCRQSLFERLLHWEQHERRTQFTGILRKQGRMHPDIAAFPNEMFYHKEHLEPVPLKHQTDTSLHYDLPSEDAVDEALKQHRVMFLEANEPYKLQKAQKSHETQKAHESQKAGESVLSDKANPQEARIVADLLRRIYRFYGPLFNPDKTVGVIVPYRNQIAMIRQEIELLGLPALQAISIDTVERYQGSQRDVIIYSFTVSRPYQLDFLTSNRFEESDGEHPSDSRTIDRKLNVAITRARKQLIMTGNSTILCRDKIFEQLIARYKEIIY